ncbi:MAG: hypothetical protein KAH21_03070, partial [Spirochaetaceae bacterium]|nr:hypothetical protein [Spirochaetaceae bacterium]
MQIGDIFHQDVILKMRDDIADALEISPDPSREGIEILWVGRVDKEARIVDISAAARGNAEMVPALFPHMSRSDVVVHNHPGGNLRPSGADLNVASRL